MDISPFGGFGGPERTEIMVEELFFYVLLPLMHLAMWMSFGIIVTLFACMAQRLESSKRLTK